MELNTMPDKKKDKKILVKVSDLNDDELNAELDEVLDSLFGPDEDIKPTKNNKPAVRRPSEKKSKPAKPSE
jgi:hypothetical protein